MSTFGLKRDKSKLNGYYKDLNWADNDARTFNSKIDKLIEEIEDDIKSNNRYGLVDCFSEYKDSAAANSNDTNINKAQSNIQAEIKVIEAVIKAREDAAKAMEGD